MLATIGLPTAEHALQGFHLVHETREQVYVQQGFAPTVCWCTHCGKPIEKATTCYVVSRVKYGTVSEGKEHWDQHCVLNNLLPSLRNVQSVEVQALRDLQSSTTRRRFRRGW